MNASPVKDKLMVFLLGIFLAWMGLPAALHAMYVALVFIAFGAGYFIHH